MGQKLIVGSNPTRSAIHPQHSSLITGAARKAAEQAGLRAPIRHRRYIKAVSFSQYGRYLGPGLWPSEHRFGLPVNREEQGIIAISGPKQGRAA